MLETSLMRIRWRLGRRRIRTRKLAPERKSGRGALTCAGMEDGAASCGKSGETLLTHPMCVRTSSRLVPGGPVLRGRAEPLELLQAAAGDRSRDERQSFFEVFRRPSLGILHVRL